jgi:hypothetical protein
MTAVNLAPLGHGWLGKVWGLPRPPTRRLSDQTWDARCKPTATSDRLPPIRSFQLYLESRNHALGADRMRSWSSRAWPVVHAMSAPGVIESSGEDNPVRVIDVFVDELDLSELWFSRAPRSGWPALVSVCVAEALAQKS